MGGGPITPHFGDCPAGGYEASEPRSIVSRRLASNKKTACSERCAHLRGAQDANASTASTNTSATPDVPDSDHGWMQAMANNHCADRPKIPLCRAGNQCQNGEWAAISPRRRAEQLDIALTDPEMPDDDYSWIRAMELYHSSGQPNRAIFEGHCYAEIE